MGKKIDIDIDSVVDAIALLKASDNYTVTALAEFFGVSRPYLYKNFGELFDKPGSTSTEEKIKDAIKILRKETGVNKLSKKSVALQAKISRTSLSRDYKHLDKYISGELDFEVETLQTEETWEDKARRLEGDFERLKVQHELELDKQKTSIVTMLMVKDLKAFSAQETDLSLNKLQTQNDELKTQNRRQLNELATLRADLNDKKQQLSGGGSTLVRGHFKAKYDFIDSNLTVQETLKLFISAEKKNLEDAIEACISSSPDAVLFFQPFLSCNISAVPMHIGAKSIVIIESNLYLSSFYKNLVDSLPYAAIHAVTAQNIELARARFFCRTTYGASMFSDEFLNKIFEQICPPSLEDGVESISHFSSNSPLSVVK
jgi:AraC-like DNA-binding protein